MEIVKHAVVKDANILKVGQPLSDPKAELHNDSSSEDTVSTSESPLHESRTDFTEISDSICLENVSTLSDK
jgi:hypothetical protein